MRWTLGLVLTKNYENYEGSSIFGQLRRRRQLAHRLTTNNKTVFDNAQQVDERCMLSLARHGGTNKMTCCSRARWSLSKLMNAELSCSQGGTKILCSTSAKFPLCRYPNWTQRSRRSQVNGAHRIPHVEPTGFGCLSRNRLNGITGSHPTTAGRVETQEELDLARDNIHGIQRV